MKWAVVPYKQAEVCHVAHLAGQLSTHSRSYRPATVNVGSRDKLPMG